MACLKDDNPQTYRLPAIRPVKGILKSQTKMVQPNQRGKIVSYNDTAITDEAFRLSPNTLDESPLKCPVSTPLDGRRPLPQRRRLQFVSVDCTPIHDTSKPLPPDLGAKKMHARYKCPPKQVYKRNLEYYYMDKKFQENTDTSTNTTWLKALCAQPVGEIFYKYRKDRPLRRMLDERKTRTLQTPGELAIIRAWENNSNPRQGCSSAASKQSKYSGHSFSTLRTVSPNFTITSKGFSRASESQTPRIDSRVDFVPHPPTPGFLEDGQSRSATPSQNVVLNQVDFYSNKYDNIELNKLPDIPHKRNLTGPQRRRYFTHPQMSCNRREPFVADSNFELSSSKYSASSTLCVFNEPVVP